MSIKKEIEHAVKRVIACDKQCPPDMHEKQEELINNIVDAYNNSTFDFHKLESLTINQNGKKRFIKMYTNPYSPEAILCQCIKQILDREYRIKYPNRNRISRNLFNILPITMQMTDFTIVKFDFKDYFNSISSIYAFEKYLKSTLSDRYEIGLIKEYVYSTKYAYAGLCTSNAIAEIIAKYFDKEVLQSFDSNGVIFYERYIDDCVLILNENMNESEINERLNSILINIFHDKDYKCVKCKTKFNQQKFKYISKRSLVKKTSLDFLGYEFWFELDKSKNNVCLKYGITQEKQNKYRTRISNLITLYTDPSSPDYENLELLRHRIAAFSSREVYISKHFKSKVWHVKGFISNYGELRYLLNDNKNNTLEESTETFLKFCIEDAFETAGIDKPYFLTGGGEVHCGYNLYDNLKKNKTILLVNNIGYDYNALVSMCEQIGINTIDSNGKRRGYGTLVRDYLIKVRVGY